jgi:hypothetical protein
MRQTGNQPRRIHAFSYLANRNKEPWRVLQIRMRIENPLNAFEMKIKIRINVVPKHKNIKGKYKIKERVKKNNLRRLMNNPRPIH